MAIYLTVMDVLAMNQELQERSGQAQYLLHEDVLEAAVMRPQMHAHYGQADIIEQAATLIAGIALAHAFLDGNKRTAMVAGVTFLELNGLRINEHPIKVAQQVEAIVNRKKNLDGATAKFVEWLRPRTIPRN